MLLIKMAKDIIPKIRQIILDLCKDKDWKWKNHIESVVRNSKVLAKKTGADEEIVEIAAWMHDIAKIKGEKEGHHIIGSEEAANMLKDWSYPEEKIEKVKHCIITHSSDENYPPKTKEAKVLASADALSYFDNFEDLAYGAYKIKGLSAEEGRKFLIIKYEKSWKKLMPEARKIAKNRYDAIRLLLEN